MGKTIMGVAAVSLDGFIASTTSAAEARGDHSSGYGAFMEPSGRNRWQPVASATAAKQASSQAS
jgi:hypothetical protein